METVINKLTPDGLRKLHRSNCALLADGGYGVLTGAKCSCGVSDYADAWEADRAELWNLHELDWEGSFYIGTFTTPEKGRLYAEALQDQRQPFHTRTKQINWKFELYADESDDSFFYIRNARGKKLTTDFYLERVVIDPDPKELHSE